MGLHLEPDAEARRHVGVVRFEHNPFDPGRLACDFRKRHRKCTAKLVPEIGQECLCVPGTDTTVFRGRVPNEQRHDQIDVAIDPLDLNLPRQIDRKWRLYVQSRPNGPLRWNH